MVRAGVNAAIHFRHLGSDALFGVVSLGMEQEKQQLLFQTTAFDVDGVVPTDLTDDEVAEYLEKSAAAGGLELHCCPLRDGLMQFEIRIAENLVLQGRGGENLDLFFRTQLQHIEAQVSDR